MFSEITRKWADFYSRNKIKNDAGYVYILESENGLYKIGKTHNPKNRFHTLSTASPVGFTVFRIYESADCSDAEQSLHKMFSDKRERGEWFRLTEDDKEYLLSLNVEGFMIPCYI